MNTFKMRSKRNNGKMPQGFEFIVTSSGYSPSSSELKSAAEKAGFPISSSACSDFEMTKM
ncbi:MAG: hypothetical protein KBS65_03145 [Prevotella sp.]|nr:hypothetical protein [Candidatus Equicola stercoris]